MVGIYGFRVARIRRQAPGCDWAGVNAEWLRAWTVGFAAHTHMGGAAKATGGVGVGGRVFMHGADNVVGPARDAPRESSLIVMW